MKSDDSINHHKLTYSELAIVLAHLGFVDQSNAKETVFFNKKHDILFKLAKRPPTAEVFHLDLMGITFHLVYKNLIEEREDLWKLVEQLKEGQAASA